MSSTRRKTFVAREDLLVRMGSIAKRKGFSLYETVNEVFELVIQAEDMGIDLRKLFAEKGMLNKARQAGFILGLESLWYDMAEFSYRRARDATLKNWFDAGVWLAKRYIKDDVRDPFEAFRGDIQTFMWNAPEFSMDQKEKTVSVRIISPRFSEPYSSMLAAFLQGSLETFGWRIATKDVGKGAIRLEAMR
jgi:hypothetical protein